MTTSSLPTVMKDAILQDAISRDSTIARRATLLEMLWNERYLTRSQLIIAGAIAEWAWCESRATQDLD